MTAAPKKIRNMIYTTESAFMRWHFPSFGS